MFAIEKKYFLLFLVFFGIASVVMAAESERSPRSYIPKDYKLGELQLDFTCLENLKYEKWNRIKAIRIQKVKKYFLQHPEEFKKLQKLYRYVAGEWFAFNDADKLCLTDSGLKDLGETVCLFITCGLYFYMVNHSDLSASQMRFIVCFMWSASFYFYLIYKNVCLKRSYKLPRLNLAFMTSCGLNPLGILLFGSLENSCQVNRQVTAYFDDLNTQVLQGVLKLEQDQVPCCARNFLKDLKDLNQCALQKSDAFVKESQMIEKFVDFMKSLEEHLYFECLQIKKGRYSFIKLTDQEKMSILNGELL